VNCTHVRYLKLRGKEDNEVLSEALSKFYHLQVLDIGLDTYSTVPNGMNNLISLRHLVASKAVHSSISSIGKMTSLQELHDFKVKNCTNFEIAQLQSMSELAQLGVSQLEKVATREQAYGANLTEKLHLEKLHLSWEYNQSQDEYDGDMNSETSFEIVEIGTSKEVLEGFEPHQYLNLLQISGYRSYTFPDWLASTVSVTYLQTLHLEDCRELQVLPSLERLPLLTKLKLRNMQKVRQVTVPPLEELVLIKMPKLERCSCNSVRDLNWSTRILMIEGCGVLKVFPLFDSCAKIIMEQKSWLFGLSELTIHDCPNLIISHTLPPSSSVCRLSIARVSTLPEMKGSTNGKLTIRGHYNRGWDILFRCPDKPTKLDDNFLSIHNLRALTSLHLENCVDLFSPDILPEHACEDMADVKFNVLPSLKHLDIFCCGISGKWLSVMLRHAPALEELDLQLCNQISGLSIEETESSSLNHTTTPRASSASNPEDTLPSSTPEGLLRIPSNLIPSLKKIIIMCCDELTFQGEDGFSGFTSLEKLTIRGCPKLIPSLVHKYENKDQRNGRWLLPHSLVELEISGSPETLQPCFLEVRNCLKKLEIAYSSSLELLQLRSCTALEELMVNGCESLAALEGNFACLKELVLEDNSGLESLQLCTCTTLEGLMIKDCASLSMLEGNFTCLRKLQLQGNPNLKSVQLRLCTALEELLTVDCESLDTLEDFRSLRGLRYLDIFRCPGLSHYLEGLSSQGYEVCAGLERLRTDDYSLLAMSFCKYLTSLRRLEFSDAEGEVTRLTDEQESALQLLTSLQELRFGYCGNLAHLPVGLHSLPYLKRLEIIDCEGILRLPIMGLPPSLEELVIKRCPEELTEQCRKVATTRSKPRVKIDWTYVN